MMIMTIMLVVKSDEDCDDSGCGDSDSDGGDESDGE